MSALEPLATRSGGNAVEITTSDATIADVAAGPGSNAES